MARVPYFNTAEDYLNFIEGTLLPDLREDNPDSGFIRDLEEAAYWVRKGGSDRLGLREDMDDWLDTVLNHGDVFLTSWSGYWSTGVAWLGEGRGWLVYVHPDDNAGDPSPDMARMATHVALHGHKDGLAADFYLLDKEAAEEALAYGLARWGEGFVNGQCDYGDYDLAVQHALLGEVVYG